MTATKQHKKVILVGDGAVGSSYAFALVNQGIAQELGIIEIPQLFEKPSVMLKTLAMPLPSLHLRKSSSYFMQTVRMLISLLSLQVHLKNQAKLVLTLLAKTWLSTNLSLLKSLNQASTVSSLVAANPVDVLTYSTWKFSGFPKERVIGSGTSLDSARFRQALAEKIGIDARSVHAYIMGEHGDSEFAVWSHANVAGVKLEQWLQANRDLNEQDLVGSFHLRS